MLNILVFSPVAHLLISSYAIILLLSTNHLSKETALEYHEEYIETVEPLTKGKWSKITNLTNWKSSYPDIIQVLGDHLHWCHDNGAEYSVFAIEDPVTMRQLKALIEKSKVAGAALIFKSIKEADKFLKSKGY